MPPETRKYSSAAAIVRPWLMRLLAKNELTGAAWRGVSAHDRRLPGKRVGAPDELGNVAGLLTGTKGGSEVTARLSKQP